MFLSQIYLSDDGNMHSIISKRSQKIQKLYKKYDYKIYTNSALEDLIKKNFDSDVYEAYNNLVPYTFKADLGRFCILYLIGGWYFDIGINLMKKIKIDEDIDLFFFRDLDKKFCLSPVTNAIIFAKEKRNPIFLECIKKITENVKNKFYGQSSLDVSSVNLFSRRISYYEDKYIIQYGQLRALTPDLNNKNLAFVGQDGTIYAYFESLRQLKIRFPEEFTNVQNYNEFYKNKTVYKS
jgi:hypothetical protein